MLFQTNISCALITILAALLFTSHLQSIRLKNGLYYILLFCSFFNVIRFNIGNENLAHSNFIHYYLGAKYSFSYFDFYKLIHATLGRPQTNYRDLKKIPAIFRDDPREQRLYFLDLLEAHDISFNQDSDLLSLKQECLSNKLFIKEGNEILNLCLPSRQIPEFREDIYNTLSIWENDPYATLDYGFNGSPLYTLIRKLDPMIWMPLTPLSGLFNHILQLIGISLAVFLCSRIFCWKLDQFLILLILVISSYDYVAWSVKGLVTLGWILPVIGALWGFRDKKPAVTGFFIAWAGLIKLFPFVLLLPLLIKGVPGKIYRHIPLIKSFDKQKKDHQRFAFLSIIYCMLSIVFLIIISSFVGHSWFEFIEKIIIQFGMNSIPVNSVSLSMFFFQLGISQSPIPLLIRCLLFGFIFVYTAIQVRNNDNNQLASTALFLIPSLCLLLNVWPNYYCIMTLFLFPDLLRRRPIFAIFSLALLAISYALPNYGGYEIFPLSMCGLIKITVPILLPITLILERFQKELEGLSPNTLKHIKFIFSITGILVLVAVTLETNRFYQVRKLLNEANSQRLVGNMKASLNTTKKIANLRPRDPDSLANLGSIYFENGQFENAIKFYQEALDLKPDHLNANRNYGILNTLLKQNNAAIKHLQLALSISSYDEMIHLYLGKAYHQQGNMEKATASLNQARRINPDLSVS